MECAFATFKCMCYSCLRWDSLQIHWLVACWDVCRKPEEAKFIFVVPPDKYETFRKQKVVSSAVSTSPQGSAPQGATSPGSSSDSNEELRYRGSAGALQHVPQFAMCLDLASTANGMGADGSASLRQPGQVAAQHKRHAMQGPLSIRAPARVARQHVAVRTVPAIGMHRFV